MKEALDAQVRYASEHITAGLDYTRNIGVVHDFMLLYQLAGTRQYLDQAVRLFHELRAVLSTGDLFTESGQPIVANPPFIDDDNVGPQYPYVKPYIIGYALGGLPELAQHIPQEPKLQAVVSAVADFLAESQDAVGGWRYPHPRSSYLALSHTMEHAWQLAQADIVLGPQEPHLDAIERILRQRFLGWRRTGQSWYCVIGWEISSGIIKEPEEIYTLYRYPEDRDLTLDYDKGNPSFGSSSPEGTVYFTEVLSFYLKHRDSASLLSHGKANEPVARLLSRVPEIN